MKDKINVAELLKDCPKDTELNCTMYDNLYFDSLNTDYYNYYNINCYILIDGIKTSITFTKYGTFNNHRGAKCVIFPKGKTTWDGFVPPCTFKAGDVLVSECGNTVLFSHIDSKDRVNYHCIIPTYGSFRIEENTNIGVGMYYDCVLANEQQRQRMYDKIKCSGHKYNQNTNKLEKLIQPKFKVGDRIRLKNGGSIIEVTSVNNDGSICVNDMSLTIKIEQQDNYELIPNKFDISTLKPFDKVLVRDNNKQKWTVDLFSFYDKDSVYTFACVGHYVNQCIPYEENEHLLGTTNDCDEFYKNW